MRRTPLVAVVADRKPVSFGAWRDVVFDGLPHTYALALTHAGGAPLLVPSLEVHLGLVDRLLDAVDGLLLAGGRDVDAQAYGQRPHPDNDPPLRVRDDLEVSLVRAALERDLPVLGACRGMQLMNVAMGGTLEQHLADRVEMTPHRDVVGTFTSHAVRVEPGSLLASVVGDGEQAIASHHHQGVDVLGEGLVATAHAHDGVVEAVERPGATFCLGVQWHPEEMLEPHGLALVSALVDASAQRAGRAARAPAAERGAA